MMDEKQYKAKIVRSMKKLNIYRAEFLPICMCCATRSPRILKRAAGMRWWSIQTRRERPTS